VKPRRTISFFAGMVLLGGSIPSETRTAENTREKIYHHQGIRIHFKDIGEGKPIVFIHGFGASIDTWRFIVDDFKQDYRLVLLDLKGHGYSDRPPNSEYSLQDHADIVLGLMQHLGLTRAVVVGHSLGSAVAVTAALKAQRNTADLISALILLTASLDPESLPLFLKLLGFSPTGWLIMKLTTASHRTRLALRKSVYDKQTINDSWVELYAKYQRIPGTDHALRATAARMVPQKPEQLRQELLTLKIPVLSILGEHDEVIPREVGESVCKGLPQCSTKVVNGVGHIPHEEKPKSVVPLLKDFIRGL
jgi:pimeloyl-ACP methyl ester carboxylesterase